MTLSGRFSPLSSAPAQMIFFNTRSPLRSRSAHMLCLRTNGNYATSRDVTDVGFCRSLNLDTVHHTSTSPYLLLFVYSWVFLEHISSKCLPVYSGISVELAADNCAGHVDNAD